MVMKIYHFFVTLGIYGGYAALLLFLLSIFKSARSFCGVGVIFITYIWGVGIWLSAAISLFLLWHWLGFIIGCMLFGVGVVPLAAIAMLINGYFADLGYLVLSVAVLFGVRLLASMLARAA